MTPLFDSLEEVDKWFDGNVLEFSDQDVASKDDVSDRGHSCKQKCPLSDVHTGEVIRQGHSWSRRDGHGQGTNLASRCVLCLFIENVALSDELFFDDGVTFTYNDIVYYLKDFIPYDLLRKNVANYDDVFGKCDYPLISNNSEEPITILMLDDNTVNVYEERELGACPMSDLSAGGLCLFC